MDQNEYRKAKETGGLVDDAGLQAAETELIDDQHEEDLETEEEVTEELEREDGQEAPEATETDDQDEPEQLSPKEKTAFDKRMERERVKLEEKLRADIEQQLETKYSKHREAIEAIGGDPDKVLAAAKEAQVLRDAQVLADRNGWTQEETQWYVEQEKQKQELKELRVQMQINRLKDNPDYAGIGSMEREILAKIDKSNGALTVDEAYWALGGPKKAAQIKLESQQREVARRAQQPRTVVKDAPSTSVGEKPLPPSVLAEAKKMGINEAEARRLMNGQSFSNIDEWRESKKKQAK